MEKNFTVNKRGKYYNVEYIGYKAPNATIDIRFWNNFYCSTKEEVKSTIKYICDLEEILTNEISEKQLNYNPKKLIRMYLKIIESVASGFDIRSKWSIEKYAKSIIESHGRKYDEAVALYEETLSDLKENPVHYGKKWRLFDKCNDNKNIYEFEVESFENYYTSTFSKDLDSVLTQMNELLEKLDKKDD